jgi:hypothetical protein
VDYVESGLPRWLIEAAFVCFLLQSASNWTPLMHLMEAHVPLALAAVQTFGSLVMYVGLMRGMKALYRPMTAAWWVVIALNIAGILPYLAPGLLYTIGLPLAVSLMLIYLPLGTAIAICYRGRLQHVGVWMVLYILTATIVPVVSALLVGDANGAENLPMELLTIIVPIIYACVIFRVLYRGTEQA